MVAICRVKVSVSHRDAWHHDGKKIVGAKEVPECIGQRLRDPDRRHAIDVHDVEEEDEDTGAGSVAA